MSAHGWLGRLTNAQLDSLEGLLKTGRLQETGLDFAGFGENDRIFSTLLPIEKISRIRVD